MLQGLYCYLEHSGVKYSNLIGLLEGTAYSLSAWKISGHYLQVSVGFVFNIALVVKDCCCVLNKLTNGIHRLSRIAQARSSALAQLGTLQPEPSGSYRTVDPLVSVFNFNL